MQLASKKQIGTSKPKPKKTHGDKLADSVEKLAVADDTPKVKSKNLNVVEEYKKSGMKRMANFVVIGTHELVHLCD
jgi:elongation factor 1 alpha-like protein